MAVVPRRPPCEHPPPHTDGGGGKASGRRGYQRGGIVSSGKRAASDSPRDPNDNDETMNRVFFCFTFVAPSRLHAWRGPLALCYIITAPRLISPPFRRRAPWGRGGEGFSPFSRVCRLGHGNEPSPRVRAAAIISVQAAIRRPTTERNGQEQKRSFTPADDNRSGGESVQLKRNVPWRVCGGGGTIKSEARRVGCAIHRRRWEATFRNTTGARETRGPRTQIIK